MLPLWERKEDSTMARRFDAFSDWDLVEWLAQYSGVQAGFYPGLRRSRLRAERVAAARGIRWWLSTVYDVTRWRMGMRWVRETDPLRCLP